MNHNPHRFHVIPHNRRPLEVDSCRYLAVAERHGWESATIVDTLAACTSTAREWRGAHPDGRGAIVAEGDDGRVLVGTFGAGWTQPDYRSGATVLAEAAALADDGFRPIR